MRDQVSKMRLISMFYLAVFASALLLTGLMGSQKDILPMAQKSTTVLFSSATDTVPPIKNIHVSAEPNSEDATEGNKKHDLVPFEFDFSFSTLIQWFFKLPAKSLSEATSHPAAGTQKQIWLSVHNVRI